MATIYVPKLYRRIGSDKVLWCHGNRRSSLGGYIGRFTDTYEHRGANGGSTGIYSPNCTGEQFIPMDQVEPLPNQEPHSWGRA